jgi:hypothetical protein
MQHEAYQGWLSELRSCSIVLADEAEFPDAVLVEGEVSCCLSMTHAVTIP